MTMAVIYTMPNRRPEQYLPTLVGSPQASAPTQVDLQVKRADVVSMRDWHAP